MSYDINFILEKVYSVFELSKKGESKIVSIFSNENRKKRINYSSNYLLKVDLMERIKYHAELGTFPEKIFIAKAPRQTAEELQYIRENYKQVTLPVYLDYLSTINRIFHDTNYNISYQKEELIEGEEGFQEYVETDLPVYGSLESFMKFLVPHLKSVDANGIIAVRPYEINYKQNENGEVVVDDSELFEPYPIYYSSEQIIAEEPNEYYLIECNEKSPVEYYNKIQNVGRIFEFYDSENIWRITQTGKYTEPEFFVQLIIKHDSGKVPCIKLNGIPSLVNGELVYISPFNYAVDLLDLVAINSSYLQIVINNCVFPFRVMYGDVCEFEYMDRNGERSVCSNGLVYDSLRGSNISCPSCSGSGLKSRVSPLGVMLLKPRTSTSEGDSGLSQTPMEYIEPTMNTPEFLMKKIDNDELKARNILHLHNSSSVVNQGEKLATDMMLDLKALYAFIKPISDQIFSIWEFVANQIGVQRYGDKFIPPVFTYPISFDFNTEKDYTAQISEAIKAGMPPFVLQSILWKYLQSVYYNEKNTASIFNLIYNSDRLLPFTNDEIALKLSRGTIQKWEAILHDSALNFVDQLIAENPDFFFIPFEEQRDKLIQKAKDRADEIDGIKKDTQMNVVDSIMQNSAQIAQATMEQEASAEELKAQANLKGSVGGVQGIIEIQNSVSKGITEKESAIAMLQLVYGFTIQEAERLVGDPKTISDIQSETGTSVNVSV